MVTEPILAEVYSRVGWKPAIDLCCSVTGSNACAPFYFDAMSDGLRQAQSIAGMDVIANPVFDRCLEFLKVLTDAYDADPNTRALFVVPKRKHCYYDKLGKDPRFSMVAFYFSGAPLFTRADATSPLDPDSREQLRGSTETITIWEMNQHRRSYPDLRVDTLLDFNQNMVP